MSIIKEYYQNGALMATGEVVNGLKEGRWTFYYEKGQLLKEINFSKGVENGEWKMWHENGNLYLSQHKEHGQIIGIWKEYYENGKIKEIGEYKEGEYFPIDFWDEDGQQLLKEGTGKKIEKFGHSKSDIIEQYYNKGQFVKEEKISSTRYGKFIPKQ